jgi:hypothetical protein
LQSLAEPIEGWVFVAELLKFPRLRNLNAEPVDIFEAL